jgi:hypothetical protein
MSSSMVSLASNESVEAGCLGHVGLAREHLRRQCLVYARVGMGAAVCEDEQPVITGRPRQSAAPLAGSSTSDLAAVLLRRAYESRERGLDPCVHHPEAPDDRAVAAAPGAAACFHARLMRRHKQAASFVASRAGCGTSSIGTISDPSFAGSDLACGRGPDGPDSARGVCALP